MRRNLVVLDILLVLALGALVWKARTRFDQMQISRQNTLGMKVVMFAQIPLTAMSVPDAVNATKYADIVAKDLFSKDRNPTVIIDPPVVELKKMPPLPFVYGVLGLPSGTKAIMSEQPGLGGRVVRAGDTIGQFRIVVLDQQNVTFDWNGEKISRKTKDLIDRSNPGGPGAAHSAPVYSAGPLLKQ